MGIIKTALMSGVGVYGINKLAKANEQRHSSPAPNSQNYNNDPPQGPQGAGYWRPPGPPPNGARQANPREDSYYGQNSTQQQRQWYPTQGPADGGYVRGYEPDYEDAYQARDRQYNTPPPYGAQQQSYQQQALPYELSRSSPAAGGAGSMGTATESVDGKKGQR